MILKQQSWGEAAWFPVLFRLFFSSLADMGHSCWKKRGMQLQRQEPGGEKHLFTTPAKIIKIPQENSTIMTASKSFPCTDCMLFPRTPLWIVSLVFREDKMSIGFCVDKPFHKLQIDSSSVQPHQGIALLCTASFSLSVCLLPCCHAHCCISRRQTLVIFLLQCTTVVCVLRRAHQATAVWRWEVFHFTVWEMRTLSCF